MSRWLLIACACLLGRAQQGAELTGPEAKRVLVVVLKHEHYDLAKRGVAIEGPYAADSTDVADRGFWHFGVTYDAPQYGATEVLGSFAVSRLTGDVWETNACQRYHFPSLTRLQDSIMRRTGKTFSDETAARTALGCPERPS